MSVFALVDGNSFYASCEAVFRSDLRRRPIVVLSNNDGCIVAANAQAKSLFQQADGGRKTSLMFQPYFKLRDFLARHQTAVFSSNYALYGDLSSRIHAITASLAFDQEIYSIDESFLDLRQVPQGARTAWGQKVRQSVWQKINIPVAVGIGTTKTLAKAANHLAKKQAQFNQVLDLTALDEATVDHLLAQMPVGQVWGVGRRLREGLAQVGIQTALDLKRAEGRLLRKKFSINVLRTQQELRGQVAYPLHSHANERQQIRVSRSFSQPVADYKSLEEAAVSYGVRAAQKLRRQGAVAHFVTLYLRTDIFRQNQPQYHPSQSFGLIEPSDNDFMLAKVIKRLLKQIYRPGFLYKKAGVILSELQPKGQVQLDLWMRQAELAQKPGLDRLMQVIDQSQMRYGKRALFLAAQGLPDNQAWLMRRQMTSPRYTTCWQELLQVS